MKTEYERVVEAASASEYQSHELRAAIAALVVGGK